MKYINYIFIIICFLIEILPIKSEGDTVTFSLKAYDEEKEYRLINSYFISYIKELYINDIIENISPTKNLTLHGTNNIVKIVFNDSNANCSSMFKGCKDIESFNSFGYNLSSCTNFNNMFEGCESLTSIDLSFLKNVKIINMGNIFSGCSKLKSLDLSHLDLSSVIDKNNVFKDCNELESINFSYINLTGIQSLSNLFSNLISLKSIELSNLIIPNLNDIQSMFFNCPSLESIDLSFIDNTLISNMGNMFAGCSKLESIDFSDFHFLNTQINMSKMFSNCTALTYANLSKLYKPNSNSYVFNMSYLFTNCSALLSVDLSNSFISSSKIDMKYMFSECSLLTSVDFTNFNSSSNKNMSNTFYKCKSLSSIDLSSLSNIEDFFNSFNGCTNLKSIDFSNLNYVKNMSNMFYQCESLLSLDLSNFDLSSLESMEGMFSSCTSLIKVNFENSNLKNVKNMKQMFYGSDTIANVNFNNIQATNLENMAQMFYGCDSMTALNLSYIKSNKISNITQLFYKCSALEEIDLSNLKTSSTIQNMDQVFYDCSSLTSLNLSSFVTDSVESMKEMFSGCSSLVSLNLSNFNFDKVTNVENMFKGCSELEYANLYNFHDINGQETMFEGVKDNLVFCFGDESKAQNMTGNLKIYNCTVLDCSENYQDKQKKLIMKGEDIQICSDKCDDDVYKYEFNKKCYEACPEDYSPNAENICEKMCELIVNFITIDSKECIYIFNSSAFFLGDYELVNSNDNLVRYIANETINDIENGTLDDLLMNVKNENKVDYIIKEDKKVFQITSSYNQNNKEYKDISQIYLGECETILKRNKNIGDNETLIIFKIDIYVEGIKIPIVKYEVFDPNTNEKLNLNSCNKIKTAYPVSIDESMIFKYDPSSDFYNDICYPYTTEKETDIVLYDRKNEYNKNNMSLCEKNCDFIEYNPTTKKAICECDIQERTPLQLDDIINKERLLNNFVDIETISNINLLKCYETLFSIDSLITNVGSYIILSIVLIYIASLFIFIIKEYALLMSKIKNIIQSKRSEKSHKNIKFVNKPKIENENNKEIEIENDEEIENENNKEIENENNKEIENENNKEIEIENDKEIENENNKEKEKEKENEKEDGNGEILIVKNPPKKNKKNEKLLNEKNSFDLINSKSAIKLVKSKELIETQRNEIEIQDKKKLTSFYLKKDEYKEEQKTDFSTYNDYELNTFSYKKASIKDKRTFSQLLISLIKTKHLIIFTFYQTNDYNSQIIKICLFFFSFALYYGINGLFFNDETMHKIYEDEGIFNFIYFIPQIIYSAIISSIIYILIKELSSSEKNIVKIKQEEDFEKTDALAPKIIKFLIIKFILFFLLSFLFLAFFWYYISCFGAVYKNTQIILLKDTLISFSISLVYPFIFYLLIALIRYPTLDHKEKCLNNCYIISRYIV